MLSIFNHDLTLQTFADSKSASVYAAIKSGTYEDLVEWAWQENEKGAGIFVTVNQTDGTWREENTITKIRAYFCDIDGLHSEQQKAQKAYDLLSSKLPPSAIVRSGGGIHAYWYVKDGEPLDGDRYKEIEMGIIQAFDGCPRTKDIARVLRMPGFLHKKDPNNPYLIEVMHEDASHLVTGEELRKAYPYQKPVQKHYTQPAKSFAGDTTDVWQVVLKALSEWRPVDGKKHAVVMTAFGVAKKFGISESQAYNDLLSIVQSWDVRSDPVTTMRTNARWAYQHGGECHISGLRTLGVDVPKLAKHD